MPQMEVITVRVYPDFWYQIDRWRKKQSPVLNRSEAIRALTASGLASGLVSKLSTINAGSKMR